MNRLSFQHVLVRSIGLLALTTLGLAQNVTDPCSSYSLLEARARNTSFNGQVPCGEQRTEGDWYRFEADGVGEVVTECPNGNECGIGGARVWINGSLPSNTTDMVSLAACLKVQSSCCSQSQTVAVKNCGGYYVYNIGSLPPCASVCLKIPDTTLATSSSSTTTQTTITTKTTTTPTATTTSASPTTTRTATTTTTPTTSTTPTTTTTPTSTSPTTTPKTTTTHTPPTTITSTTTPTTTSATTTTTHPTTFTTFDTPSVPTDPCVTYTNLTDGFSMIEETNISRPVIGQHPPGWYRMSFTLTGRLATECPLSNRCGSGNAIWLKDPPDENTNRVIRIQLCLRTNKSCCEREVSSMQKLCPGFVVYDLPPSMPRVMFCYNNSIPKTDSTTHEVSTADIKPSGLAQNVTDPCSSYSLLEERARNTSFNGQVPCGEQRTEGGWYRFHADGVGEVVTECPNGNECGIGGARVWINECSNRNQCGVWGSTCKGSLPSNTTDTVSLAACLKVQSSCCSQSQAVPVKNCGEYFVYNIGSLPICTYVCLKIPDTTLATSSSSTTTQTTITTKTSTTPTATTTSASPTTTRTATTTTTPTTTTSTPTTSTTPTTTTTPTLTSPTTTPTTTTTHTPPTTITSTTTPSTTTTPTTTSATTTTTHPTTFTTFDTPSVPTDPCVTYTNLTDGFSMIDETNISRPVIGQHPPGWYRMSFTLTGRLATECPLSNRCGSGNAIWLKDSPDENSNRVIRIQLCLRTNKSCCEREVSSMQKLCPGFVVYDLPPSMPRVMFCYNNSIPKTDSTTHQVSTATSSKTTVTSSKKTVSRSTTPLSPPDASASKVLSAEVIAAIGGSAALIVVFIIVLIIVQCSRKR